MKKLFSYFKKHWREVAILIMFLVIHSAVNKAVKNSEQAYDYAADAAHYARQASEYASDASDYASEASDNASNAADSASYCEYLQ